MMTLLSPTLFALVHNYCKMFASPLLPMQYVPSFCCMLDANVLLVQLYFLLYLRRWPNPEVLLVKLAKVATHVQIAIVCTPQDPV